MTKLAKIFRPESVAERNKHFETNTRKLSGLKVLHFETNSQMSALKVLHFETNSRKLSGLKVLHFEA